MKNKTRIIDTLILLEIKITLIFFLLACATSCNTQVQVPNDKSENKNGKLTRTNTLKKYGESDTVSSSLLDKNGNIWFGTTDEGVYKYNGKTFTNYSAQDGLCDNHINAMTEDDAGNLWFGTANGLCKYDGQQFTSIDIPWNGENNIWGDMCNPNVILAVMQDKSGYIWIGSCGGGAFRYDPTADQSLSASGEVFTSYLADNGRIQSDSRYHNVIKSIVEDGDGNIWFTSLTHGAVSRFDGTEFVHFSAEDGLSDDMVFCSLVTRKGDLWFGCIQTFDGGLYRYNASQKNAIDKKKSFTNFNEADGLCDNFIMRLYEDNKGNIWIATGKSLCIYNPNISIVQQHDETIGSTQQSIIPFTVGNHEQIEEIRTFVEDKDGNLWFGGRFGNLWRYDGKTLTDYTHGKYRI